VIASRRGRQDSGTHRELSVAEQHAVCRLQAVEGPKSLPRGTAAASAHGADIVTDAGLSICCSRDRRMRSKGWSAAVCRCARGLVTAPRMPAVTVLCSPAADHRTRGVGSPNPTPGNLHARASTSRQVGFYPNRLEQLLLVMAAEPTRSVKRQQRLPVRPLPGSQMITNWQRGKRLDSS
jgi:hypothetical protein